MKLTFSNIMDNYPNDYPKRTVWINEQNIKYVEYRPRGNDNYGCDYFAIVFINESKVQYMKHELTDESWQFLCKFLGVQQ